MAKCLIIGEVFYPEEFLVNDVAREWSDNGHQIEVLTRTPSYPFGKVFPGYKNKLYQTNYFNKIKVHRFFIIPGYRSSKIIKVLNYLNFVLFGSMIALFIGRRFDKVFVYQTGPLTLALPAVLIKKLYSKKVTIWSQDLWPDTVYAYGFKRNKILDILLKWIVKMVYGNTENILVTCNGFIPKLKNYVPEKKIEWIPNWSSITNKEAENKIDLPGEFRFTFTGNVGKVQNIENVIVGFSKITTKYPSATLNIVGDGSNLEHLKMIVETKNIENVYFYGRQPLELMPSYFEASNVLVISLNDEEIFNLTIPAKFQTYLSAGKPILGAINGEVKSLIDTYKIGKTASPVDTDDIASVFKYFITEDKQNFEEMILNAKRLGNTTFDKNILISKLSSIVFQ